MFKGKDKEYRSGICGQKCRTNDTPSMLMDLNMQKRQTGPESAMFTTFCDLYSRSHETTGEASVYKVINTLLSLTLL